MNIELIISINPDICLSSEKLNSVTFLSVIRFHCQLINIKNSNWKDLLTMKYINIIITIGFFLRVCVSLWNGFWGPSFGAEADAAGFHYAAMAYANSLVLDNFVIGHFYSFVLGIFYYLITDSLFFGSFLSSVAWLFSSYVLMLIMRLLSFDKSNQIKAMLIYAFLPTSIIFTGITLREPYQLLFVNIAIYSVLKIYLSKSAKHWVFLFCAVMGMGVLHGSLLAFGIYIIIAIFILHALRGRDGLSFIKFLVMAPPVALIMLFGLSLFTSISYNLEAGFAAAIQTFQEGALNAAERATYKDSVEIDGITGLLIFVPISLFQYLFEPMPWRVSAGSDVIVVFENILRGWLLWKAFVSLRNLLGQRQKGVLFVFTSYLLMEVIWSVGTINWGTALRHHLPSTGLLLVAAFAYSGQGRKGELITPQRSVVTQ